MKKKHWISLLAVACMFLVAPGAGAQDQPVRPKQHKFAIYAGLGPNIYFNNLVLAKEYVKEANYSFMGRFMWEPEHLLSIGIESGYYCLYRVDFGDQSDVKIANYAIPIMLAVNMKFLKNFYINVTTGQSILKNNVSNTIQGDINASTLSLGDFSGALGYRRQWKKTMTLGVEGKFFYASKLNDKNVALLFTAGFQL
jgi:hypothetical protein